MDSIQNCDSYASIFYLIQCIAFRIYTYIQVRSKCKSKLIINIQFYHRFKSLLELINPKSTLPHCSWLYDQRFELKVYTTTVQELPCSNVVSGEQLRMKATLIQLHLAY